MIENDISTNIFNFEDDLFECESKESTIKTLPTFVPNNYHPKDGKIDSKLTSDRKLYKYHADYLYFIGKFSEALEIYEKLEILFSDNPFMTRAVKESQVWCLIKTERTSEAEKIAEKLKLESSTFEQQMSSRYLLNVINGKVEDSETILNYVQQCEGESSNTNCT